MPWAQILTDDAGSRFGTVMSSRRGCEMRRDAYIRAGGLCALCPVCLDGVLHGLRCPSLMPCYESAFFCIFGLFYPFISLIITTLHSVKSYY